MLLNQVRSKLVDSCDLSLLGAFQSRYSEILGSGYEEIPPRFDQQYCGAIGFYDKLHTNWLHENANSIRSLSTNFGTKTNSKFEMGRLPAITFYQLLGNSEQCKFSDWLFSGSKMKC